MDQVKIGKFIAERRRQANLTQMQLAEKLNITDRAVSKWETGRSLPDSSIMLELCQVLKITVNDLLCGEVVTMDNYTKELENNLIEVVKQKEQADKRLLKMELITGILCLLPLLFCAITMPILVENGTIEEWLGGLIGGLSVLPLLIALPFLIKIEQTAGYYECQHCGHKHVPKYKAVFFALHVHTTRYLKCPNCGKKSWQKKTISKD
jgi:transcriptional regulator with XRE-family HTH domain/DNA-directed RNA polymerase subunit RPC12/RpoP